MPKTPVATESVEASKKPRVAEKPDGYFDKNPAWRFSLADVEHPKWSVLDSHEDIVYDPNDSSGTAILHTFSKSIDGALMELLKARESTTWGVLLTQTGGRTKGTNSHHILMKNLIRDAQKRAAELDIVEYQLLSLRLDGTHRVFGILEEGVLNIIWFDRDHEICPSPP